VGRQKKLANHPPIENVVNHLKHDMQRIYQKEKCLRPIGPIESNGKENIMMKKEMGMKRGGMKKGGAKKMAKKKMGGMKKGSSKKGMY
jgi:hypothetical protein